MYNITAYTIGTITESLATQELQQRLTESLATHRNTATQRNTQKSWYIRIACNASACPNGVEEIRARVLHPQPVLDAKVCF